MADVDDSSVTPVEGVAITARALAETLLEHPDSPVIMMLPTENAVRGVVWIGQGDGLSDDSEPDPAYPNGVFLVAIDLHIPQSPGAAPTPEGVASGS